MWELSSVLPSFNFQGTGSLWVSQDTQAYLMIPGFQTFISSNAKMELGSWVGGCMALKPLNLSRPVFGEKHSPPTLMDSTDMSLSKLWEIVKDREAWHAEFMGGIHLPVV